MGGVDKAVAIVFALVFAAVAQAQGDRPTVQVTPGKARVFHAAVQRFADRGLPARAARADEVLEAIGEGLDFNALIVPLADDAFLGPDQTVVLGGESRGACSDWTQSGADALVEGVIDRQDGRLVIEYAVWDTARCLELGRGTLRRSEREIHRIGALIADEVVGAFTGTKGVAATEIAFVSDRDGDTNVMVMNADGSHPRFATRSASTKSFPNWVPNGEALVYTAFLPHGVPRLYLSSRGAARAGPMLRDLLPDAPMYRGVFSPGGNRIAIVASPNDASDIYMVRRDGRELTRITRSSAIDVSPSFSPDGRQLAFVSDRSGAPQIFVADADGANSRRLTFSGSYNSSPAWSPDGRWIAYVTRVGDQFDVWLIDPTGAINVPLVTHPRSDEYPAWSPDSRKIAFSSKRRGKSDIYVVEVGTGDVRQLTRDAGSNKNPAWAAWPR